MDDTTTAKALHRRMVERVGESKHTPALAEQKLAEAMGILNALIQSAEQDDAWASDLRTAWEKLNLIRPTVRAAPDLLEAVETVLHHYDHCNPQNHGLDRPPYKALRTAIARARGEGS